VIPLDSSALQRVSSGNPAWLGAARAAAFDLFESLDLPADSNELWKYVELDFDLGDYGLPVEPAAADSVYSDERPGLVVSNGIAVGPGFESETFVLKPLAEALGANPELAERYDAPGPGHDKFSAGHRAFGGDGAFVSVAARRVVPAPLFVDLRAGAASSISFPRVMIDVADGGEAAVVVDMASPDELTALVIPEVDVTLGDGANLRLTVLQTWGASTTAISRVRVSAGRDANITLAEAGLGGLLSRLHLEVDLEGRGSSARIVGAYFGDRDQVLDYRYFMRHIGENTSSDMFLKGAVEDRALSVFTGMIRIEEDAQRTNAFQTNRNLLLSPEAAAQSVPNLEILANDVKCGHGSSVGPLDAEQRYYLMSRGLDAQRADRLQVRGFFEEALHKFPEQSVTAQLRTKMNAKYVEAQEEGRV
jgi:Fe-S cluster assembly protein SufD